MLRLLSNVIGLLVLASMLAAPVDAQRGVAVVSGLTNAAPVLTIGPAPALIPPAGPGMTLLELDIDVSFAQSLTVTSAGASGLAVSRFENAWHLDSGSIRLCESTGPRQVIQVPFAIGSQSAAATLVRSAGVTFSTNLPQLSGPLVLSIETASTTTGIDNVTAQLASTYEARIAYRYR